MQGYRAQLGWIGPGRASVNDDGMREDTLPSMGIVFGMMKLQKEHISQFCRIAALDGRFDRNGCM